MEVSTPEPAVRRPLLTRSQMPALAWFALALVGQVAALQLMRAGPRIGYQRYAPPAELFGSDGLPWLAILALQAVAVAAGGQRFWRHVHRWVIHNVALWKLAAFAAVFVGTAAVLEIDLAAFGVHLVLGTSAQVLALATILLAVRAANVQTAAGAAGRFHELITAPGRHAPDRFAWWAAGAVVLITAVLGWLVYEWHPHVPDELVYLLHARYLADGMLSMPLPSVPEAFELDLMTYEATRWYSTVPIGWPAVLSVGARLGLPWLVNPVLAGACVLLTYSVVARLYDRGTARLVVLLLCASPWFLFMSMNLMTHTLTLFAALAGALAVSTMLASRHLRWGVVAGVCIGVLGLIRPLEGLIVAALFTCWVLSDGRGSIRFSAIAVMAIAAIAVGGLTLPYNAHLTGDATLFPIMAYTDALYGAGTNALGFGPNRGLGWPGLDPFPGHGLKDVILNTAVNSYQLNVELHGWATGSLIGIGLLLLLGGLERPDWMMVISVAAVIGAHAFYWFSGGPDFGPRYWYLILVPCIVLSARGIQRLASRLRDGTTTGGAAGIAAERRVHLAAAALCCMALLVFVPWRATDKYHGYRGMRPDVRSLAREHDFGRSLVLVRGRRFPDYAAAAAYNPVDLQSDDAVYAWDRSPEVRQRLLQAYPDRMVWIIAGPSVSGNGFQVERGPVRADVLLEE